MLGCSFVVSDRRQTKRPSSPPQFPFHSQVTQAFWSSTRCSGNRWGSSCWRYCWIRRPNHVFYRLSTSSSRNFLWGSWGNSLLDWARVSLIMTGINNGRWPGQSFLSEKNCISMNSVKIYFLCPTYHNRWIYCFWTQLKTSGHFRKVNTSPKSLGTSWILSKKEETRERFVSSSTSWPEYSNIPVALDKEMGKRTSSSEKKRGHIIPSHAAEIHVATSSWLANS